MVTQLVLLVVKKIIGRNYKTDIFKVVCAGCNVFRYGEQFLFAKYLDERFYAGLSDELYIKSKQIVKFTNSEIEDMILKYKKLVDSM